MLRGGWWTLAGYAGVASAFLILPFYSVVGGWTIAYAVKLAGGMAVFGALFFILLAVAALTSALSMLEVAVAYLADEKGIGRKSAALGAGLAMAEITADGGRIPAWAGAWRAICRYIAPAVIGWILIAGL